jgi:hypothetical protein
MPIRLGTPDAGEGMAISLAVQQFIPSRYRNTAEGNIGPGNAVVVEGAGEAAVKRLWLPLTPPGRVVRR